MTEVEIRSGSPVEVRQAEDGTIRVSGHAAVFNQEANIAGLFRERFERGAFSDAIGRDDVVFLVNHDGLPLARTRSGTLRLSEDAEGLRIDAELDSNDPDVQALEPKLRRGDVDQMSIAFIPEVQEWDDTEDPPLRTISQASLRDVSAVTHPAYEGTDIGLRALEDHKKRKARENFHAARHRVRMKQKHLARREREKGRNVAADSINTHTVEKDHE